MITRSGVVIRENVEIALNKTDIVKIQRLVKLLGTVAQQVEHKFEELGCEGSIPSGSTNAP